MNNSNLGRFSERATMPTAIPTKHQDNPGPNLTIWTDPNCFTGVAPGGCRVGQRSAGRGHLQRDAAAKTGAIRPGERGPFQFVVHTRGFAGIRIA